MEYGRKWGVFKALPERGLLLKGKEARGGKKSKQRFTIAFFVNSAGGKEDEPIVIWKSKVPRCFKNLGNPSWPHNAHSNSKSWMNSDIFQTIHTRLNRKLEAEDRKVILFLDNATCHPEDLQDQFSNIKIVFLPKNTTSRLQPLDAGIIRNFKVKYRKLLIKYVVSQIDAGVTASEIVKKVDILMAIRWIQIAWKDVSSTTIVNCFRKCGFTADFNCIEAEKEEDLQFEALVSELCPDTHPDDFIDFDNEILTCEPPIDTNSLGWRGKLREECIQHVINPNPNVTIENVDYTVSLSDEDEDPDDSDGPGLKRSLSLIDELIKSYDLDNDDIVALNDIQGKLQNLRLKSLKQSKISSFFQ